MKRRRLRAAANAIPEIVKIVPRLMAAVTAMPAANKPRAMA